MIQVYPKVVEDALKWQGLELAGISAEKIPPALVAAGILDPDKEWHYGGRTPPGTYVMLELNEVYSNLLALQSWEFTIAEWEVPTEEYDPSSPRIYTPPPTIDNTLPSPGFGIDNSLPTPPSTIDNTLPSPPDRPDQGLPKPPNVISGGPADKPNAPNKPTPLNPDEKVMLDDLNKLAEEDEKKKKK